MTVVHVPHIREVFSNISGSVSIACWVILLLPQLMEQWRLKSADGVALGFILIWLLGDLANLVGSIIGQLRPSVVLLAMWFCFSDALLVLSYCYYKRLANSKMHASSSARSRVPSPQMQSTSLPSDIEQNRNFGSAHAQQNNVNASTPLLQDDRTDNSPTMDSSAAERGNWLLSTGLPAIFVIVVATLSYFISDSASPETGSDMSPNATAEFLGYFSAVLYLVARIPQIIQNHRRRSVEGLSMGFFALSILGNLTYAGQVIIYRTDRDWLVAYIPWLLGSLGTIVEDLVILAQFHIYRGWK